MFLMLEYYDWMVVLQDKKALLNEGIDQHYKFHFKTFLANTFWVGFAHINNVTPTSLKYIYI